MPEPTVGKGGEISVFGKNVGSANILLQLYQKAFATHFRVQWVKWLHLVQLFDGAIAFAQWRHTEVDKSVPEGCFTEKTARRGLEVIGEFSDVWLLRCDRVIHAYYKRML
jgi:hypothetical protein